MQVCITGASGLVGSSLVPRLTTAGHQVLRLDRHEASGDQLRWNPETGQIDADPMNGTDAVVHLAGENIASRWTTKRKERIRASRVRGTRLLCETLAGLANPPKVLVSASAVGYYGDRGSEALDEASGSGEGSGPAPGNGAGSTGPARKRNSSR